MAGRFHAALGVSGALLFALFAFWWWEIASGPGDDNPLGIFFAAAALASLFPASVGLFKWFARIPVRDDVISTALALLLLVPLALFAVVILMARIGL